MNIDGWEWELESSPAGDLELWCCGRSGLFFNTLLVRMNKSVSVYGCSVNCFVGKQNDGLPMEQRSGMAWG
jgi:hypothetical protein